MMIVHKNAIFHSCTFYLTLKLHPWIPQGTGTLDYLVLESDL